MISSTNFHLHLTTTGTAERRRVYSLVPEDTNINYHIPSSSSSSSGIEEGDVAILRWNNTHNLAKASLYYIVIDEEGNQQPTKSLEISQQNNNGTGTPGQRYTLTHADNSTRERFSVTYEAPDVSSSVVDIAMSGGIGSNEQFIVILNTSRNSFRRTFSGYGRCFIYSEK